MTYTTPNELKAYLGITSAKDDALLSSLIDAAQSAVELYTGRTFEASADSIRYFDPRDAVDGWLWLDEDLAAITSITNGDGQPVTAYVTQPATNGPFYAIKPKASSGQRWSYRSDPEDAIAIEGRWAYSVTPPAAIKQATMRLAAYYYRQKDAQVFDVTANPDIGVVQVPQGIPADVRILLDRYRRLV